MKAKWSRTGYVNMQEINKKIFGAEVIEATGRVHGLNAEGEVCGSYRPTRHPGVRARPFEIASASSTSHSYGLQVAIFTPHGHCRSSWCVNLSSLSTERGSLDNSGHIDYS